MTWHNISDPPDDCRIVEVIMAGGERLLARYDVHDGLWFSGIQRISPVGWRELDVNDE